MVKRQAAIAAIASVLMVGTASAQDYEDETACEMYEHVSFRGRVLPMASGQSVSFRNGQFWNDRVSSVRVAPGCSLVVYQHTRMRGASQEFFRNVRSVRGWNDQISSAECICDDQGYDDYQDGDYDDQ